MRALAKGIPMVCVPMGRDQSDKVAKVAYHDAGIRLSVKASPSKISKAVSVLLSDQGYQGKKTRLNSESL